MNVSLRLYKILSEFNSFGVPIESNSRLVDDLGLDSLTIIEFLTRLEVEFQIEISDVELTAENFGTVEAIVTHIESKMKEGR